MWSWILSERRWPGDDIKQFTSGDTQMSASVMWGMAIGRHIDVCSLVFPFPKLRQEKDGRSGLLTPGITKILSSSHIASIIYLRYLTSRGSTLFLSCTEYQLKRFKRFLHAMNTFRGGRRKIKNFLFCKKFLTKLTTWWTFIPVPPFRLIWGRIILFPHRQKFLFILLLIGIDIYSGEWYENWDFFNPQITGKIVKLVLSII